MGEEVTKKIPKIVVEEVATDQPVSEPILKSPETFEAKPIAEEKSEFLTQEKVEKEPLSPKIELKEKKEEQDVLLVQEKKSFNVFWIIIPGLLILGGLVGGIWAYYSGLKRIDNQAEVQTTEVSETPSPSASPSATPSTNVNLTKYQIMVLNGSGISGEAGRAKTILEGAGFRVSSTANAKTYNYTKTTITVNGEIESDFLKALTDALSKSYQLDAIETVKTQTSPIIVTVGSLKAK